MRKRRSPRYVTPAKVEQIRTLHAEGLTDPEIAARLDFDKSNVAVIRGQRLGLKANRKCHFWTGRERKQLIEMAGEGKSRNEIAAAMGIPARAIAKQLQAIRLGEELDARRVRSQARREQAWDMLADGLEPPAIAARLGLHEMTIYRYARDKPADWGQSRNLPAVSGRRGL